MPRKSKSMSAMSAGSNPVPFTEFGPSFIRTILSAEMLASQLDQAIPKFSTIPFKGIVLGTARIHHTPPKEISSDDENCEIRYEVGLVIDLDLGRHIIQGTAKLPLTIVVHTFAPATVFVDVLPVDKDEIHFDETNWNMELLIAAYGIGLIASPLLSLGVRAAIAGQINSKVKDSLPSRIIDLAAMVPESQIDGPPGPVDEHGKLLTPIGPGEVVEGVISPGDELRYGLQLLPGARVGFTGYFRCQELSRNDAAMTMFVGPTENGARLEWEETGNAIKRDYRRIDSAADKNNPWFIAPAMGTYEFGMRYNDYGVSPGPQEYRIVSTRMSPVALKNRKAKRICFDVFGVNFIHAALSPALIQRALQAKVSEPIHMDILKNDSVDIEADVNVTVKQVTYLIVDNTAEESAIRADLELTLTLDVEKPKKITYQVCTNVALTFRIHTFVDPAKIVIHIDPVTADDVPISEDDVHLARGPKILGASLLRQILGGVVQGKIAAALQSKLSDQVVDIQKTVDDKIKSAPPPPDPEAPGAPTQGELAVRRGSLAPGRDVYYEVALNKDEILRLDVELFLKKDRPFAWDVNESLGVCDSMGGILHEIPATLSGDQTETKTFRLEFKAPADGTYLYRLKTDPFANEEDLNVLNYKIAPVGWLETLIPRNEGDISASSAVPRRRRKAAPAVEEVVPEELDETEEPDVVEEPTAETEEGDDTEGVDDDAPPFFWDPDKRPLPEYPVDEAERRWIMDEGTRELYVVPSGRESVFHFVKECPALERTRKRANRHEIDAQMGIDEAAEELQLDVCGTCMGIAEAAETRIIERLKRTSDPYECMYCVIDGNHRMEVYCDRVDYLTSSGIFRTGGILSIPAEEIANVEKSGNVVTANFVSPSLKIVGEQNSFSVSFVNLEARDEAFVWVQHIRGIEPED